MYYPIGWPRILDGRGATGGIPLQLLPHRIKNILFEIRGHSVAVWNTRLHILLASFKLSPGNISKHGVNCCAALKPDGTCLAVGTSNGLLYFLDVGYNRYISAEDKWKYSFREHGITQNNPGVELPNEGPALEQVSLSLSHEVLVTGSVSTSMLCPIGGLLMVPLHDSTILRINWEGVIDTTLTIDLRMLVFTNEHQSSVNKGINSDEFVVDIAYSMELHGLAIVTSNGRVAFVTGKSAKFYPDTLQGFWLKETTDGICVAINPKYSQIVCGRSNGLVDCYIHDDTLCSWILVNTLQLSKLHFADSDQYQLGPVQCLVWSLMDCSVLLVVWKNGGMSMWSVFGSLLFHSLGNQPGTPTPLFHSQSTLIMSACWSNDGYQLWMLPRGEQLLNRSFHSKPNDMEDNHDMKQNENDDTVMIAGSHLVVLQFLKSGFVNNPVIPNHDQLLLHSGEQVYLGPPTSLACEHKGLNQYGVNSSTIGGLGKAEGIVPQWNIVQFPSSYLILNWPVLYVSINDNGDYIAIAGKAGFAVYVGKKRRWKLFGSELQEQNLSCRGGITWYIENVLVFPCRLNDSKTEEIHFYDVADNLDTSRVLQTVPMSSHIIKINILKDTLVIANKDCSVTVYTLKRLIEPNKSACIGLEVTKKAVLQLMSHVSRPWVNTLVSIIPSTIRTETGQTAAVPLESLILNIGGRVVMVQREQSVQQSQTHEELWNFSPPVSLSPYVEAVWSPPINHDATNRNYMMESLWLACGAHGIKVWVPLYPQGEQHHTFLSKRIMLTLPSSSYFPQCIMLSDAVIVGVSHEPLHGNHTLRTPLYFPPTTVRRITRLFLNHVLRQLLKRNLGSHAFDIARSHANLPYFAHILELMLHEILEEEASSSVPIPDALLPRAIDFIKQFPQFLETVGSCARKTEVALWQYLFAAVGNPKDLFELCLTDVKLTTAATYLIIIQNLEPPSVSRHLATRLLDSALDSSQWDLCRDLVRFLKAIGPTECSTPSSPIALMSSSLYATSSSKAPKSAGTPIHFSNSAKSSNFIPDLDQSVASVARQHLSTGSVSNVVSISGDYYDSSGKVIKRPHFSVDMDTKEEYFIELILSRHARKLLSTKCIRDLGLFASHLDFDLVQWMSKERHRAAHIDNYVNALLELHNQFHWPLPSSSNLSTPTYRSNSNVNEEFVPVKKQSIDLPEKSIDAEKNGLISEDSVVKTNLRRPNRPPNLDIHTDNAQTNFVEATTTNTTIDDDAAAYITNDLTTATVEEVIVHSSTPSKHSAAGSCSFTSESVIKISGDVFHQDDTESIVENLENWKKDVDDSLWNVPTKTLQSEKEIKYFVCLTRKSMCLEWNILLGILLQDITVFTDTLDELKLIDPQQVVLPDNIWSWLFEGINALSDWAAKTSPGYLNFMALVTSVLHQYQSLIFEHVQAQQDVFVESDPTIVNAAHVILDQNDYQPSNETKSNIITAQENTMGVGSDDFQIDGDTSSNSCVVS